MCSEVISLYIHSFFRFFSHIGFYRIVILLETSSSLSFCAAKNWWFSSLYGLEFSWLLFLQKIFFFFLKVSVVGPLFISLIHPSECFISKQIPNPILSELNSFSFPEKLLVFLNTEWCQHKIEMAVIVKVTNGQKTQIDVGFSILEFILSYSNSRSQ